MVNRQPFAAGKFQSAGIEPKLVQNSGMDVGHIVSVFNGMEAKFIGGTVDSAASNATASQPD